MPEAKSPASGGKAVTPFSRSGTTGVSVQSGYIVDQEKSADLRGQKKFTTYSELLANVEICAASVRLLIGMIGKAKWTVEPAIAGNRRAEEIAELVDDMLFNDLERPWPRVVKRTAMYSLKGYSWQEWIAKKRDDGAIGFLDIENRTQSTITRWDTDEAGVVYGVWQESPQSYREMYIPRAQSVYIVDDTFTDSPEGMGIMRNVAPAADRLQKYEQLEGVGFENDLRGVPIGYAPYNELAAAVASKAITQAQADAITDPLESFVGDHIRNSKTGFVIDSSHYKGKGDSETPSAARKWGIDILSSGATSQEAAAKAIERLTRGIARLTGTEFLLLGESGAGSLAMSKSKTNTFGLIVDGSLIEIASAYEKDLIRPIGKLNGWPKELLPKLKTEKLQHRDASEIVDVLEGLGRAGAPIMPDDEAINVTREIVGLPAADLDEMEIDSDLRTRSRTERDEPTNEPQAVDDNEETPADNLETGK